MIKHFKERMKKIYFLKQLVRFVKKYYHSDPKFISLLTTFETYAPNSIGKPRLKSKLTKNTINGIFKSINLLYQDVLDVKVAALKIEDFKLKKDEKISVQKL